VKRRRERRGSGSSPRGTGGVSGVRSDLGVGFQDRKKLLGAPVSGGGVFGGRGSLTRDHGLKEDHLRLLDRGLDDLHRGAEAPRRQSGRIIPRLQRKRSKKSALTLKKMFLHNHFSILREFFCFVF